MWKKYASWMLILTMCFVALNTFGKGNTRSTNLVESKADEVLRRMGKYLAGAKQFRFEAYKMVDIVLDSGQKIQLSNTTEVAVSRPDKIWVRSTGDTNNEKIWYRGDTLSVWAPEENSYATAKVPSNIDEMMDYVVEKFGVAIPLADLVISAPYESAIQRVRSGQYVGLHYVRDVKCHHLAFRQEGLDWQIWIEQGDKPLPRKLVITHKELPGHPQFIAFFDKWDLSPKLSAELFIFKAPEGAEQIEIEPLLAKPTTGKMLGDSDDSEIQPSK